MRRMEARIFLHARFALKCCLVVPSSLSAAPVTSILEHAVLSNGERLANQPSVQHPPGQMNPPGAGWLAFTQE